MKPVQIDGRHALNVVGWFPPMTDKRVLIIVESGSREKDLLGKGADCIDGATVYGIMELERVYASDRDERRLMMSKKALSWITYATTMIVSAVYVAAIILPILFPRYPYRTPISSIHLFPTSPTNIMEEINHHLRRYLVMLHIPVLSPRENLPLPPRQSLQHCVRHLQYPRYPRNLGRTRRPLLSTDVVVSTLGISTKRIEDEGTEVRPSDMTRRKYIGRPAARSYMWI
ncbi:hypothetical protein EV421DRAFT_1735926 [Armillaria borealis]|uniref:Uncharacterized protein n=1 Tax=Armillaria borealis TaxID=47425 RepID=A0AA39JHE5_9AGAR|nr:hypothetical protein EV421DRAFT_1735926 [Armillaria borealis]